MTVYFADTLIGFLGRNDGTEDGGGGAGCDVKDGMKDAIALLYVTAKWRNVIRGNLQ